MPRKPISFDLDDAIKRYLAGETSPQLARQFGVSDKTIRRRLKSAGIAVRPVGDVTRLREAEKDRLLLERLSEAFRRYEDGEPAMRLAKEFGVSYKRFIRLLAKYGIRPRTVGESSVAKYARMTFEERRAYASAAHAAKRGRPANLMSLERRAQTLQRTVQLASRYDLLLGLWLAQRGIVLTPQKAVGRYNIDLAVHEPAVAVEVLGAGRGPYSTPGQLAKRRAYLLDCGWRMIEVKVDGPISALHEAAADQIVALLHQAGESEALSGEHWVIGGDGELLSPRRRELDDGAVIGRSVASPNV